MAPGYEAVHTSLNTYMADTGWSQSPPEAIPRNDTCNRYYGYSPSMTNFHEKTVL